MTAWREFDVLRCPLEGINLIEASAGTGKTWNICGLYLRLLLERGLDVQHILVVTFTHAATAELRERIRARIAETLAFVRGDATEAPAGDPLVPELVAAAETRAALAREQMARRLDLALQYFDEAAIFTIHGFCQRALAEASFSARLPLRLELVTDGREMTLEAVRDFWRRRIADAGCSAPLAAYLVHKRDDPQRYAPLVDRRLAKPLATYRWPAAIDAPPAADPNALTQACGAARALWAAERDAIVATVKAALGGLHRRWYSEASVDQAARDWDLHLAAFVPGEPAARGAKIEHFTRSMLAARTNKGHVPPAHAFFDAADALLAAQRALLDALDMARLALIRDLIDDSVTALRRQKRARRLITFDDMLYNLYAALAGEPGRKHGDDPGLAGLLRQRFPAALIDEFQDTDPLQFAVFEKIYGDAAAPLFLVGDPKQAIYSFRHADLYAYLAARRKATAAYTLERNQRASSGLIAAQNALFGATAGAFMLPGLDYHPVVMGARERPPMADRSSGAAATGAMQVWTLPRAPDGTRIAKRAAQTLAGEASAAEIARLIDEAARGRIAIGAGALQPGDIAVLVRTHAQGSAMKRALAALDVASVELSQASVFRSVDAEEVERVLLAVNEPSRDDLLRGALATEMLGHTAGDIAGLAGDETQLLAVRERFARYRERWQRQGVGVMYRRLLTEERVSARMLRRQDGERRLTNLLHLGEQIHEAAALHESPDAMLRWLQARRRDDAAADAAQLRLESDRNLVQIITIHKAKGLEFPIVFCPFLWDGSPRVHRRQAEACEYHDAEGNAVVDFRLDAEIGDQRAALDAQAKLEAAAEDLRLIYVALTRAIHRCYVVAGTYERPGSGRASAAESAKSLLNWLAAGGAETPQQWFAGVRSPDEIDAAWIALANRVSPQLRVAPLSDAPGKPVALAGPAPETLCALPAPAAIVRGWRFGSFSSLARDAAVESAATDHDAHIVAGAPRAAPAPPALAPDDILRFPRGARAGDCLHSLLERVDFADSMHWNDEAVRALLAFPQPGPGLPESARLPRLARMATGMLDNVLRTPLHEGIMLRSVPAARRLAELEFTLPARQLSPPALNAALRRWGYEVPRLAFRDLEGYLKGFIDLVFEHDGRYYLVDWKSNHLGYAASDYGPAALRAAIRAHGYALQYLLYALAVSRYLRQRIPGYAHGAHFGGVLYLFVRAIRPGWVNPDGTRAGVFFDRPPADVLAGLDALLAGAAMDTAP